MGTHTTRAVTAKTARFDRGYEENKPAKISDSTYVAGSAPKGKDTNSHADLSAIILGKGEGAATADSRSARNDLLVRGVVNSYKEFESRGKVNSAISEDAKRFLELAERQYKCLIDENQKGTGDFEGVLMRYAIVIGVKDPNKMIRILSNADKILEATLVLEKHRR